eukprot:TRINITY_DN3807_c0_g1_i4.p1 TRINITY_DN3807_c0_g1~~TRINITY_DN3807_c0_g1_i4.p1  ORF type:complete len:398 (+),score=76.34 TRINITY_DN3807_c0_g1_i4:143-1336(+)
MPSLITLLDRERKPETATGTFAQAQNCTEKMEELWTTALKVAETTSFDDGKVPEMLDALAEGVSVPNGGYFSELTFAQAQNAVFSLQRVAMDAFFSNRFAVIDEDDEEQVAEREQQDSSVFDLCSSTETLFSALCTTYKQRIASIIMRGSQQAQILQLLAHSEDQFRKLGVCMMCDLIELAGHYSLMTPFIDSCATAIRDSKDGGTIQAAIYGLGLCCLVIDDENEDMLHKCAALYPDVVKLAQRLTLAAASPDDPSDTKKPLAKTWVYPRDNAISAMGKFIYRLLDLIPNCEEQLDSFLSKLPLTDDTAEMAVVVKVLVDFILSENVKRKQLFAKCVADKQHHANVVSILRSQSEKLIAEAKNSSNSTKATPAPAVSVDRINAALHALSQASGQQL